MAQYNNSSVFTPTCWSLSSHRPLGHSMPAKITTPATDLEEIDRWAAGVG